MVEILGLIRRSSSSSSGLPQIGALWLLADLSIEVALENAVGRRQQ
jgi:hypothetical protein